MATVVMLKHPSSGLIRKGFFGFSWTTLFFGGLPAIFRGDLLSGLIVMVLNLLTCGVVGLIWAFFYNKNYTARLLEKGYVFADSEGVVALAKLKIGVTN